MVAELAALGVAIVALAAESLHARRVARLAPLAFGPTRRPTLLGRARSAITALSLAAITWGMATLLRLEPKVHRGAEIPLEERRHLVLALDVSPSMRLKDAGPTRDRSRTERVADLLESLFARIPMSQFRISIIAVYNGSKPVVTDTTDGEVVWNILRELPMHYAFPVGKTRLFDGLTEAADLAHPWPPGSASLVFLSDGDTVPATDMPRLPPAFDTVLIVGVGDPKAGSFIEGRQSRQDVSALRQIAARIQGDYHNGNDKQIPSELAETLVPPSREGILDRLTRREYALLACALGGLAYGILPLLLHYGGTGWRPGVRFGTGAARLPRASDSWNDARGRPAALVEVGRDAH